MNIFDSLQNYGGKWNVVASRAFAPEEQAAVKSASVVVSDYGKSVCFLMVAGGNTYIPLSNTSNLEVGDPVDIKSAKLLTLHRDGNKDINRVEA